MAALPATCCRAGSRTPHRVGAGRQRSWRRVRRSAIELILKIDAPDRDVTTDPVVARIGQELVKDLNEYDFVLDPLLSIWTEPAAAKNLISKDKQSTLIIIPLAGGENEAPLHAEDLAARYAGSATVCGSPPPARHGVHRHQRSGVQGPRHRRGHRHPDQLLVPIFVFGGVIAASLPIVVGVFAIIGTLAILRLFALFADVSIFTMNLATAMGLALAIDYTPCSSRAIEKKWPEGCRDRRPSTARWRPRDAQ